MLKALIPLILYYLIFPVEFSVSQKSNYPEIYFLRLNQEQFKSAETTTYKLFKRSNGDLFFNNHFSQKEKELIITDKESEPTELIIEKIHAQSFVIILVLVFLLALGLGIGLYKHYFGRKELKARHKIITDQAQKLETLDKAKSRFYSNVSHELRTPLSLILAPLKSLMNSSGLSEKQMKLHKIAFENGRVMEDLISEILDLTKLEMGKMEVDEKPIHLKPLLKGYCSHFESLSKYKCINFNIKLSFPENLVVLLDQSKFRQIVYNLLNNSFKYTEECDEVSLKLFFLNNNLNLEVFDSGRGIHPDDLPHIFDRYFQTSQPDRPVEGGTGIGLALCKEYAQLFGGRIEVESKINKGTKFKVSFPVKIVQTNISENEVIEQLPIETNKEIKKGTLNRLSTESPDRESKPKLLIVEDNVSQQEYLEIVLKKYYDITIATNGKVALDLINEKNDYQLILSDLMMPVMDGNQLLEKLKSQDLYRHIPFVMLTGRADLESKLNALRIGVDDYIVKPYEEEEVLTRIDNLIKNQQARQKNQSLIDENILVPGFSKEDEEWLKTFEDYIRNHLKDGSLSIPNLAWKFSMSESSILRRIKRLTGLTPARYINEIRLAEARITLLNKTYSTISQVSEIVGFRDTRSFSRSFKKRYGRLPSDYLV